VSGPGLLSFPLLGTVSDASGNPHPAYHDGDRWHPLGEIVLGYGEVTADVAVATGATVTFLSVPVTFAGVGQTCRVTVDLPSVDFTSTSGGECELAVTVAGVTTPLAHMHGDRSLGWPARSAGRMAIPGAGAWTFDLSCRSISGPLTLHADNDVAYGPIAATVTVVG
jgi:hypothetical protein